MKGRFRRYLRELLLADEAPERTALTYGFGVFIGFSPFFGFHTLIAILVIFLFRVNRVAILAGVYTNTPWTLAPAATFGTAIGFWLLGIDGTFPALSRAKLASGEFRAELLSDLKHVLLPFLVGNLLLALALGIGAFFLFRFLARKYRGRGGNGTVRAAVND